MSLQVIPRIKEERHRITTDEARPEEQAHPGLVETEASGAASNALNAGDRLKARFALFILKALNICLRAGRNVLFLRRKPPREPRCIIAHLVGNVGDVIVGVPALVALRERYPESRLILFTSAGHREKNLVGARELLEGAPFLDGIETYSTEELKHPRTAWRLLKSLRSLRPDLFVALPPCNIPLASVIRNLFFARFTGARFGVGFELVTLFLFSFEQAQYVGLYKSEIKRNLEHLRELGITAPAVRFELAPLDHDEAKRIADVAARNHPFVALCPGGKQVKHRWPTERFREVAEHLKREWGVGLIAVGSSTERELCDQVLNSAGGGINFAGELSLRGTAELLSHSLFLLTNDTGPMHLAGAVGTPVVAIFGSRDLAGRWHPHGDQHELFRAQTVCRRCLFTPEETDHCVKRIQVREVMAGCQRLMEKAGSAPHVTEARTRPVHEERVSN